MRPRQLSATIRSERETFQDDPQLAEGKPAIVRAKVPFRGHRRNATWPSEEFRHQTGVAAATKPSLTVWMTCTCRTLGRRSWCHAARCRVEVPDRNPGRVSPVARSC